jgi:hypothetical protein
MTFDVSDLCEYFAYLDDLRDSGATNMYAASSYLVSEYDHLTSREAQSVLTMWMRTFDPEKSPAERAEEAQASA